MSKKLLTKLLAFTMSAGLVLQPVAAFAAEPSEGDLTETVVAEEEQTEPEAAEIEGEKVETPAEVLPEVELDKELNLDSVPLLQENPQGGGIIGGGDEEEEELPELQNVTLEDDILRWDHTKEWSFYYIFVGPVKYVSTASRVILWEIGQRGHLETGEYPVELYAVDRHDETKVITKTYRTTYYFTKKERTKISNIELISDHDYIPKFGQAVDTYAPFSVSYENYDYPVMLESFEWQALTDDGWATYDSEYFDKGTYRFYISMFLDVNKLGLNYELDPDLVVTVDGEPLTKIDTRLDDYNFPTEIFFASDEYVIEEGLPIQPKVRFVYSINATSNYDELKAGCAHSEPIIVDDYGEAEFDSTWEMLGSDGWEDIGPAGEGKLMSGTYRIKTTMTPQYNPYFATKFGEYISLYVDLDEWEMVGKNTETMAVFVSPEFEIKGEIIEPVGKTKITSANVTSNYETIPELYGYFWSPTFEVEDELPIKFKCYWSKKEMSSWDRFFTDKVFENGQYRCEVYVEVDDEHKDTYELDPSFTLIVNGKEWTKVDDPLVSSDVMVFASEAISVGEVIDEPAEPPIEEEGQWHEKYGAQYYELPDGKKATGKQKIGEETYFFSNSGTLQKNVFCEEDGNKFYFGSDGKMIKGWFEKWGSTYYADENGAIQTGFVDIGANTYHFDAAGKRSASVWLTSEDKRFYVKADGRIAKAETIHRWGKAYTFDAEGVLIK